MKCSDFNIKKLFVPLSVLLFLLTAHSVQAQQLHGIALIDSLLTDKNYAAADSALQSQIRILQSANNIDSLAYYPYYVGSVTLHAKNKEQAGQAAEAFVGIIKTKTNQAKTIKKAYLELASFYTSVGFLNDAYDSYEQALNFAQQMKDKTGEDLGEIEGDLGIIARRMGKISLAKEHIQRSLRYYESFPGTTKQNYYAAYNSMGAMMWFSSKTDSALYFYDKALETLTNMKPNPTNLYYRTSIVKNNKAALYSITGRTTNALAMMKDVVNGYQQFVNAEQTPTRRRKDARKKLYKAIENMAGVYKELGNFTKTRTLLEYAYRQKKKYFDSNSPELYTAQVLLGQIELALKNYQKALGYLNKALKNFEKYPDEYLFWKADAYYSKALLYDERDEPEKAYVSFEKSQSFYKKAYGESYDAIYLEFLANSALFFAENGREQEALHNAQKALNFVIKYQGKNTLTAFKHRLNVASVYYELGNYTKATELSRQSLAFLQKENFKREYSIDSIQVRFKEPDAILLLAKSEYQIETNRDSAFLINLLHRLDEAIAIVDKRMTLLYSEEDVNVQIANNTELFNFTKKIALDLYKKTGNEKYLDRTIHYHESVIYNRIRSRLNARKAMQFVHITDSIYAQEIKLKEEMTRTLETSNIKAYLNANTVWKAFLEKLKTDYPRYFDLKYGSVERNLNEITQFIPKNTTVIRYFFVEENLYALMLSETKKKLYELDYASVKTHINQLHKNPYNAAKISGLLYDLYVQLWQPLQEDIATGRVLIIPDGPLFNLSFETLVTNPVTSFSDFAENSLLAKYAFSYYYSLYFLQKYSRVKLKNNIVAFAPGFTKRLKGKYRSTLDDSLFLDYTYLNLLPQPFTLDLVNKLKSNYGGEVYTGEQSTKQKFTNAAGGYQIIHIGTHAESNNVIPERSKLFFAKNTVAIGAGTDNALFAYEVYNYDFSSELTLLTACETGKPGYQPGEGMISLTHAFRYAGSKSLLISLWNIDEEASAQIVNLFYQNLSDGMSKDIALQQSKLSYLSSAQGRTAAPEYWAGLVILGDVSAIQLEKSAQAWFWILPGLLLLMAAAGYFLVNRKRMNS